MSKSKSKQRQKQLKVVKRTVKYLSHSPSNKITRAILSTAPTGVVRAIANAALNAQQNQEVKLSPAERNLFSTYSRSFDILTDANKTEEQKRKHLLQRGGALPLVVPLLASVLGSLGSAVISRVFNRSTENSQSE